MRLRLTVVRCLIVSTGLIIISLQLVILWSERRSTTMKLMAAPVQHTVHRHQQSQRMEEIDDQEDGRNATVPGDNDDMYKIGARDDGDDDDGNDGEANTSADSGELPAIEKLKRMRPSQVNQTERLLSNESSAAEMRRRLVEVECRRRGLSSKEWPRMPATMLVSDTFRVMYCMIGKVASSTWKKVFLVAAGKIDPSRADEFQHRSVGSQALRVLQPMNGRRSERNRQRIDTYFKFVFVRHPLDRLLSAFREKFRLVPEYMHSYGRRIIRQYRANATTESLERGDDVTLEEFVRFMVDTGLRFRKDVHWTSQYKLCQPCAISYDFIGHYETLWSDGDYVLQRLGINSDVRFPRWTKNRTHNQPYESAYDSVRPEYMKRLKKLYSRDYEFFGYT